MSYTDYWERLYLPGNIYKIEVIAKVVRIQESGVRINQDLN